MNMLISRVRVYVEKQVIRRRGGGVDGAFKRRIEYGLKTMEAR
jgi:hypothetical protein